MTGQESGVSSHHAIPEANEQDLSSQKNLEDVPNIAAAGISYFTPAQNPPSGTATDPQPDGKPIPKLFKPLKLRGLTFQNRIMVSSSARHSHTRDAYERPAFAPLPILCGERVRQTRTFKPL